MFMLHWALCYTAGHYAGEVARHSARCRQEDALAAAPELYCEALSGRKLPGQRDHSFTADGSRCSGKEVLVSFSMDLDTEEAWANPPLDQIICLERKRAFFFIERNRAEHLGQYIFVKLRRVFTVLDP